MYKYVLQVQKKTTRIASRASCVIYRITYIRTDVLYKSVVCGNKFGTRLHDIYLADCFQIQPKYRHPSYACLKEIWFRYSNCKLQSYAIYGYLKIMLCSWF